MQQRLGLICLAPKKSTLSIIGSRLGGGRAFGIMDCRTMRFGVTILIMPMRRMNLSGYSESITTRMGRETLLAISRLGLLKRLLPRMGRPML